MSSKLVMCRRKNNECATLNPRKALFNVSRGSSFKIVINFLRIRTEIECAVCYLCSGKFSCGSEWF